MSIIENRSSCNKKDVQEEYKKSLPKLFVKVPSNQYGKRTQAWPVVLADTEAGIREAAFKILQNKHSSCTSKLHAVLGKASNAITEKFCLYVLQKCLQDSEINNITLEEAFEYVHGYILKKVTKEQLSNILDRCMTVYENCQNAVRFGYKEGYIPCAVESLSKMYIFIIRWLLNGERPAFGFSVASHGSWIAAMRGEKAKMEMESSMVDFLKRLYTRDKLNIFRVK